MINTRYVIQIQNLFYFILGFGFSKKMFEFE
jgi:hypothetical protein